MASVAFQKIDHPDHVPADGEHARFTIAEHQKVQAGFERHHAAVGGGGGAAAKPSATSSPATSAMTTASSATTSASPIDPVSGGCATAPTAFAM